MESKLDREVNKVKQCEANVEAVLRAYHLPLPPITCAEVDRVWGSGFPIDMYAQLIARGFVEIPFEKVQKHHGPTAVSSYRELDSPSMQCVYHSTGTWEIDFDLYCPSIRAGLLAPLFHGVEVLVPGKTNPYRVRRGLLKRGLNVPLID